MDELWVLFARWYRSAERKLFGPWWNKFLSRLFSDDDLKDAALRRADRQVARAAGEEGLWLKLRIPILLLVIGACLSALVSYCLRSGK